MQTIELLTAGGWLWSLGDIATQKASLIELAKRGVPVIPVDESSGATTVIGGGHIVGHMEHLRHFVLPGRHILNAVGVHDTGDWGYLEEYRYISVRDHESAKILGRPCHIVPCPATMLSPSKIATREALRNRGGHVVVHRDYHCEHAVKSRTCSILVVDPQPYLLRQWYGGGTEMLSTHCPEVLIAAMKGANCVITRSLHMSIFALCAEVPFCCIDLGNEPQSNKLRNYWHRAGMADVMYDGNDPVHHAASLKHVWRECLVRQRLSLKDHFDRMARSLLD